MKEPKLLNCPFCGGEAKVAHYSNGWDEWWRIICKGCNISQTGSYKTTEEEAIKAWNTRKPMERILERLETGQEECYKLFAIGFNSEDRAGYDAYSDAIEIVKEEGGIE